MDIIRKNTDYTFRLIGELAKNYQQGPISVRKMAQETHVPYQLACKLLQKLAAAGLVTSEMGPRGGYQLKRHPDQINFKEIIETIQGPVRLNHCLLGNFSCPLKGKCPVHDKLAGLQETINNHLTSVTLGHLGSYE